MQRSVRKRNPPIRYGLAYTHASVTGIQEAVTGRENEQWLAAMALEVKFLEAMGTWTYTLVAKNCSWTMGSRSKKRCDATSGAVQNPICGEKGPASGRF